MALSSFQGSDGGRRQVQAALELVRPRQRGAHVLAGRHRAGARLAADADVAAPVQRVDGDVVLAQVAPHLALGPVGQRVDLDQAEALVPLDLARLRAGRRLVAADGGDPGREPAQLALERRQLAQGAAAIGVALPQPRPVLRRLLGQVLLRPHGADDEAVTALEGPPQLVGLREEQARVESEDLDRQAEARDQVDDHAALRAEAGGEGDARRVPASRPAQDVLGPSRRRAPLQACASTLHVSLPHVHPVLRTGCACAAPRPPSRPMKKRRARGLATTGPRSDSL